MQQQACRGGGYKATQAPKGPGDLESASIVPAPIMATGSTMLRIPLSLMGRDIAVCYRGSCISHLGIFSVTTKIQIYRLMVHCTFGLCLPTYLARILDTIIMVTQFTPVGWQQAAGSHGRC